MVHGLICPTACGLFVPNPGIEPAPPALQGRFLTTGPPPEKSQLPYIFSTCIFPCMLFHFPLYVSHVRTKWDNTSECLVQCLDNSKCSTSQLWLLWLLVYFLNSTVSGQRLCLFYFSSPAFNSVSSTYDGFLVNICWLNDWDERKAVWTLDRQAFVSSILCHILFSVFCTGKIPITLRARIGRGFLAHIPLHPYLVAIVYLVYHVMAWKSSFHHSDQQFSPDRN